MVTLNDKRDKFYPQSLCNLFLLTIFNTVNEIKKIKNLSKYWLRRVIMELQNISKIQLPSPTTGTICSISSYCNRAWKHHAITSTRCPTTLGIKNLVYRKYRRMMVTIKSIFLIFHEGITSKTSQVSWWAQSK